jgi:hypothetical protein
MTVSIVVSVLALMVSIVAMLMSRANVRWQMQVASREAWMREFRERVAALLTNYAAFVRLAPDDPERQKRLTAINDAMTPAYHTLRLLIAEKKKAPQHEAFSQLMDSLFAWPHTERQAGSRIDELSDAAIEVLRHERAAIEAPGRWRLWVSRQLRAWPHRILTPPSRW